MKRVRSLIVASLLLTTAAIGQWAMQESPTTTSFYEIQFLNSHFGLAVGRNGALARTTNGGQLWANVSATTENLNAIAFLDTVQAWIAGDYATILTSTDLGATWNYESTDNNLPNANYHDIALRRSSSGYKMYVAGGRASNNRTAIGISGGDGTWNPVMFGSAGRLTGIWFVDDSTGYATGDRGVILKTTTPTLWWDRKQSGTDTNLASIVFFNRQMGIVVGTSGQIRRTTDGGETWTRVEGGGDVMFFKLAVVNDSVAYACGSHATIMKTADQGKTWTKQPVSAPPETIFEGITFANETEGWAAGSGGVIVHTSNGGIAKVNGK